MKGEDERLNSVFQNESEKSAQTSEFEVDKRETVYK